MKNRIGPFFKQVRLARNLTLQDVANGRSIASLSRYEHGQIDLSEDIIGENSRFTGLDYADLTHYQLITESDRELWVHVHAQDWQQDAVLQLQERYRVLAQSGENPYLNMVLTALGELLWLHQTHSGQFRLAAIEGMSAYFSGISELSRIESNILQATIEYIPVLISAAWVTSSFQSASRHFENASIDQIQRLIALGADIAVRAGVDEQLTVMKQMVDQIEIMTHLIPQNGVTWYNFRSVEGLYRIKLDDTYENRQHLVKVVSATQVLLPDGYFDLFKQYALDHDWLNEADFAATT